MIVRPRPSAVELFFILRGSVIHKVYLQILLTTALGVMVSYFHTQIVTSGFTLTPVPFSLIGLALAIFLGFKNSASYDRFWEARKIWGELIIVSRSLARQLQSFLPEDEALLKKEATLKITAFAYALNRHLRPAPGSETHNEPNAILRQLGQDLKTAISKNALNPQQVQSIDESINALSHILGACERIRATPIPFAYTLLIHRTAYIYCFLLPFGLVDTVRIAMPIVVALVSYTFFALEALGEELEEPFGLAPNDLPLDALCRIIERDVLEGLGERDLPPLLEPKDYVLT